MIRLLALWYLLTSAYSGIAVPQSIPPFSFSFSQPFGRYAVGLRVVQQYDRSRSFSIDPKTSPVPGRPLQTLVWYPAVPSHISPMTIGDFEDLIAHETSFDEASLHGPSQDFAHAFMQGTESGRTISVRDAAPEPHRFPMVVYAPSLNAPNFENIELCEYLASYGFIVVASPSMGASMRHMQVGSTDTAAQADDVLFLIKSAKTLGDVDPKKLGVIGYSLGGTAALSAAVDDPKIRALVALDGSFRYEPPSSVNPADFTIPLLFFSRGETPLASLASVDSTQKPDGRILNEWIHADLFQIRMLAISHIQFSSLYQRSERFKREGMQFVSTGFSLSDGDESYGWIARYTMEFLKAYLTHDRRAQEYLMRSPSENGAPSRLMAISFRGAIPK